MKLCFLGTGAADWRPDHDGYRAFTSTLIDDNLLIDGTLAVAGRLTCARITDVCFTHSHADHYDPALLKALAPVRVHAHASWAQRIRDEVTGVEVVPFEIGERFTAAGHELTALPSNHSTEEPNETTVHFVIDDGEKKLLYATDGAWLLNAEWHMLRDMQLDAAVFDATLGEGNPGDIRIFEHNSLEMVRIMTRTLRRPMYGHSPADDQPPVLKSGAPVFLTHLSRELNPPHAAIEAALSGEFSVAYDGMEAVI